jgi:hypothetical protein
MKHIFILIFFVLSFTQTAQADPPAVHGMLVLGEKHVYLSHLPMFHSPHDYQVIFAVSLSGAALQTYRSAKRSAPQGTLFTIVPEPFALDQMIQSPRPFQAMIYQGHFERGGTPITGWVPVSIDRVLFAKHLSPSEIRPSSATYILFGADSEYFLAHLITGGPNFDQIIAAFLSQPPQLGTSTSVVFPGVSDLSPPSVGTLGATRSDLFSGLSEIYRESGDLDWP